MKAAMWAIIISVAIASIVSLLLVIRKKEANFTFMDVVKGLEQGARGALGVIAACACAGIIIGVVTKTGLGLKLGEILVGGASGIADVGRSLGMAAASVDSLKLFFTLIFAMVTSLILGMGVPTTANYVITSTIAAPAIIMILNELAKLGGYGFPANSMAIVLCANMFVFYFGVLADLTPPVALAAFAGAAIAKADPMKTGVQATKLAIAAFIIPYIFVYNPQMLLFGVNEHPGEAVWMVVTAIIGIVGLAAGVEGYLLKRMPWVERLMAIAGGLLLVIPGMVTDIIGAAILAIVIALQLIAA